jgi:hypothetical protein
MSSESPAVRARSAQEFAAYLDVIEPGLTEALRARIPSDSLAFIDNALPNAWIPVEHDRHIVKNTVDLLGPKRAEQAWTSFLTRHVQTPLFGPLVKASVRLFGLSPGTFVRIYPRAWKQGYRNLSDLKIRALHGEGAELVLENIHPEIWRCQAYFVCWRGLLNGVFTLAMTPGELEFVLDRDNRSIQAELRWSASCAMSA